ncbi:hypothetical protein GCM10009559_28290 [Pseudonocardia zijingensis]|uniref:Uncharacterized protein n=1 Tax=Pseudonocardia zijingensis TaxID=153376 RepID=A0ABN1Q0U1_9PSEU
MATASLGAIWSAAAPEIAFASVVVARLHQLGPDPGKVNPPRRRDRPRPPARRASGARLILPGVSEPVT